MNNLDSLKIGVVYHSADMDGLVSGAIGYCMKKFLFDNISKLSKKIDSFELIPYNYSMDIEIEKAFDACNYLIFVDCSPLNNWLLSEKINKALNDETLILEIVDHHKSKYEEILDLEISSKINYIFDDNNSAALLFWNAFVSNKLIGTQNSFETNELFQKTFTEWAANNIKTGIVNTKKFLDWVSFYDTWQWFNHLEADGEDSQSGSIWINAYYLNLYFMCNFGGTTDMKPIYESIFLNKNKYGFISVAFNYGKILATDEETKAKRIKEFFTTKFVSGYNVVLVSCPYIGYQQVKHFKNKFQKELNEGMSIALINYNLDFVKKSVNLSIRPLIQDSVNCVILAKQLNENGGGHLNAAGTKMDLTEFFNKINF